MTARWSWLATAPDSLGPSLAGCAAATWQGPTFRTRREAIADLVASVDVAGVYTLVRIEQDLRAAPYRVRPVQSALFSREEPCACGRTWLAPLTGHARSCPTCRAEARSAALRALHLGNISTPETACPS